MKHRFTSLGLGSALAAFLLVGALGIPLANAQPGPGQGKSEQRGGPGKAGKEGREGRDGKEGRGERRGKGEAEGRKQLEERLARIRRSVLKEEVGLDDATITKVEQGLARLADARRQAHEARQVLERELRQLLQAGSNDQAAYAKALAKLAANEATLAKLRQGEVDELAKHLTPKQQAQARAGFLRAQRQLRGAFFRFQEGRED
jgi:hypothetical protein